MQQHTAPCTLQRQRRAAPAALEKGVRVTVGACRGQLYRCTAQMSVAEGAVAALEARPRRLCAARRHFAAGSQRSEANMRRRAPAPTARRVRRVAFVERMDQVTIFSGDLGAAAPPTSLRASTGRKSRPPDGRNAGARREEIGQYCLSTGPLIVKQRVAAGCA